MKFKDILGRILKVLPYDKALLLIAGVVIATVVAIPCVWLKMSLWLTIVLMLLFALLGGLIKDVRDYFSYGKFDWKDVAFTLGGGTIACLIALLFGC